MSSIVVRRTPTPRQCSRKNLPIRRTSKDQKPTKALTHQKGHHLSDHGKGADANIIHVAEKTVADVKTSNLNGEQLQQHSDVGMSSPKKKTRRHSPVPLSHSGGILLSCNCYSVPSLLTKRLKLLLNSCTFFLLALLIL
jgi:hypothetical protein